MKKISTKILEKLNKVFSKYHVNAAYFFGSQVKGNTHAESDLDIAVRFDKKNSLKQILNFINDLTLILDARIDLMDLNLAPLPIQLKVYQSRRLIFVRDMKKELILKNKALSLYYDYKYYYDRFTDFEINRILTHGLT